MFIQSLQILRISLSSYFLEPYLADQHIPKMRGKRSKQYRKLMERYAQSFNFREPYQVLVDAQMIQDAARFSMNLPISLERTLHGKIKPMITQCSIRHLYNSPTSDQAQKTAWIEMAKTFERRRCNHHELEEPLSALECLGSVVDPKSSGTNKHRYVVASQEQEVRVKMRGTAGVPLVYINRSVMIMEPMAAKSTEVRESEERAKMRAGLKSRRGAAEPTGAKRKRDDEDEGSDEDEDEGNLQDGTQAEQVAKKRRKGPKGPNPLSVKKAKKPTESTKVETEAGAIRKETKNDPHAAGKALEPGLAANNTDLDASGKRKRKRKHKAGEASDGIAQSALPEAVAV